MIKLREHIMLVLNWMWLDNTDKNEICDSIINEVAELTPKYYYIDDIQKIVRSVLKSRVLAR